MCEDSQRGIRTAFVKPLELLQTGPSDKYRNKNGLLDPLGEPKGRGRVGGRIVCLDRSMELSFPKVQCPPGAKLGSWSRIFFFIGTALTSGLWEI